MTRFLFLLFFLLLPLQSTLAGDDTIKLGISGPYSGELASYGEDVNAGIRLAIDDINAKGGLLGKKLSPLFEDDGCDPKTGVAVANHFLTEKVAMAAAFCSKVCMAAAPVYAEENIPFFNECNTDGITAHGWPNVIRAYLKNSQEAPRLAPLIAEKSSRHKLAMLYFSEEYNNGLADNIVAALAASHLTPDAVYKLPENTDDFSSIISKLKDQKIDVVYLGFWPKALGLFLRQAAAANYHSIMIANMAASLDDVVKIAGATADGLIFTTPPDPKDIPSAAPVIKALAAKHIINRPVAVYAYLLMQVYAEAVRIAGSTDGDAVMKVLKGQKMTTIMGPVSFNASGDMLGIDFDYYQWQKGEMVPLKK